MTYLGKCVMDVSFVFFSKVPAVCLFGGSAAQVSGICGRRGWLLLLPLCLSSRTHPQFQWPQWPSHLWEVRQLGDWWWVSICNDSAYLSFSPYHCVFETFFPSWLSHIHTVLANIGKQPESSKLFILAKDDETDYLMNYNLTTLPYQYYRYIQLWVFCMNAHL